MSAAVFLRSGQAIRIPERVISFLFFALGALAAFYGLISFPALASARLSLGLLFAALMLLSASGLGWIILPMGLFAFGVYAQQSVLSWTDRAYILAKAETAPVIFGSLLVPLVLLASTHSLSASAAFCTAFRRASPTARSDFSRELPATLFYSLFGLLTVLYFT